jgi:hypothetical protein
MKKVKYKPTDELRPQYGHSDLGPLVRGKYADRVAEETNVIVLEPEIAEAFPNDAAVNNALRGLLDLAAASTRRRSSSAGATKKRRAG